jgi:hypothetical protein
MVTTNAPRVADVINLPIAWREPRANSNPTANSTKHSAVSGAIRPGFEVPTAPAGSVNSHWSKPGFQPKAYSQSESNPIRPTSSVQSRERRETKAED